MTAKILNIMLAVVVVGLVGYYIYHLPEFTRGERAPDFTATLINGEEFSLTDLRGDYVLLDFWGSWCGPCRRDNPKLVELSQKYEEATFKEASGFHIVSIGIERDTASWMQAIESDNLYWKHHIIQGQRFESPIAELYGITWIPTKYLVGPDGLIIHSDESLSTLDDFLAENLK